VTLKARRAWPLVLVLLFANSSRAIIHPERWLLYPDLRYVKSLAVDSRYLFAGTPSGTLRYDKLLKTWESGAMTSGSSLLASDPYSGRLYLARGKALYCLYFFTSSSPAWIRDFRESISAIGFEPDNLWVQAGNAYYRAKRLGMDWANLPKDSTANRRIQWQAVLSNDYFRQPEFAFLSPSGILGPHHQYYPISAIAKEPVGQDLWVGTWGAGIYFFGLGDWRGQQIRMGPGVDDIRAIAKDSTTIWFGGYRASVDRVAAITAYQPESNRWEYFEAWKDIGLENAEVVAIAADSQYVWFATDRDLARFEKRTRDWRTFTSMDGLPNDRLTALVMTQGKLWIGSTAGLASMLPASSRADREDALKTIPIYHLAADSAALIAASTNGLYLKSKPDSYWLPWRSEDGVLDFNVLYILPESAGVWVASQRGLEFYNHAARAWERHLEAPFFPRADVYSMASDRQNLWIGSDKGALQYDKARKLWRTYTTIDGLPDNRVQALLLDGRYIWFGTAKGAARYQWQ